MQLMTSFLKHYQRSAAYAIKRPQRHNGTKIITIIILMYQKKIPMQHKPEVNKLWLSNARFLPPSFSNHVERSDVAVQHSLRKTGN